MVKQLSIEKTFAWLLVVIWMGFIFYLSHQTAEESSELSSSVTATIRELIQFINLNIDVPIEILHHYIRKSAHFVVYLILGVLVFNALFVSQMHQVRHALIAIMICVIYATIDEFHQLFIPGRSGEITDVLIDSIGATIGTIFYKSMSRFIIFKRSKI